MHLFEIQNINQDPLSTSKNDLVDGENIIGLVEGTFFVPNGYSRNNRFYPKGLWEKVINDPNVKEKLKARTMFGTIGHNTTIDEDTIADGKISHFMHKLYIDESDNLGKGTACILNTPAGRVLKTLLSAKCKLYTSSRADGAIEEREGVSTVVEDKYIFQSFDFVLDPGFLTALPSLTESYSTFNEDLKEIGINYKNVNIVEDIKMDQKLFENLITEKTSVETELKKALEAIKELNTSKAILEKQNSLLEEKLVENNKKATLVETYNELGTPEEVIKLIESTKRTNERLKATSEELAKIKHLNLKNKKFFEEVGSKEEIEKLADQAEENDKFFTEVGTKEEIQMLIDKAKADKEFFDSIGSKEEISDLVSQEESKKKIREEKEIEALSLELQIPLDKLKSLLSKGVEGAEIKALFDKTETGEIENDVDTEKTVKGSASEYEVPAESFRNKKRLSQPVVEKSNLDKFSSLNSTARLFEAYNNKK